MTSESSQGQQSKTPRSLSLRVKVMGLVTGLVLIQGALSFFSMRNLGQKYHILEENTLLNARETFSGAFADLFFERYGDVQAFALNATLRGSDGLAMTEALNGYVALYQIYQGVLFYNLNGALVAGNTQGPDSKKNNIDGLRKRNVAQEPWFLAAIKEQYTEDKTKGIVGSYVSPMGFDALSEELTGKPSYGFHFSTLVKDSEGKPLGVLTTRSDIAWLEAEAKQVTDRLVKNGLKSIMISMVDESGKLVFDFDPMELKGQRDLSALGKMNVVENGGEDAKRALKGDTGVTLTKNTRENSSVVSAFALIKDDKVPDSIKLAVLTQAKEEDVYAVENVTFFWFYAIFAGLTVLSLALGFAYSTSLSRRFSKVATRLRESAQRTNNVALELNAGASSAAASISQQAAAVQETVASMAEMSSMIAQTGQNVRESMTLTQTATEKTEEGNRIMQRLVGSMDSIQQANGQLQNIGKVIAEITNKTAVINDIVFKTQLLSFNASIEAARAGQHGRGFAVVAAEVGNLAQMSGNAAKEIQTLLDDSRSQVQSILESTQSRVSEGQMVSADALSTFGEIAKTIEGISEQIRSISEATREQDIGVKQTNTAMVQMDEYAQKNNVVSQQVAELALETQKEADHLFRIMQASRLLIEGSNAFKENKVTRDFIDSLIDDNENPASDTVSHGNQSGDTHQSLAIPSRRKKTPASQSGQFAHDRANHTSQADVSHLADKIVSKAKAKTGEGHVSGGSSAESPGLSDVNTTAGVTADDDSFKAA